MDYKNKYLKYKKKYLELREMYGGIKGLSSEEFSSLKQELIDSGFNVLDNNSSNKISLLIHNRPVNIYDKNDIDKLINLKKNKFSEYFSFMGMKLTKEQNDRMIDLKNNNFSDEYSYIGVESNNITTFKNMKLLKQNGFSDEYSYKGAFLSDDDIQKMIKMKGNDNAYYYIQLTDEQKNNFDKLINMKIHPLSAFKYAYNLDDSEIDILINKFKDKLNCEYHFVDVKHIDKIKNTIKLVKNNFNIDMANDISNILNNSQIKKLIEFKKMNPDKSDEEVFSKIKFISL